MARSRPLPKPAAVEVDDVPLRHRMVQTIVGYRVVPVQGVAGLEEFRAAYPELAIQMVDDLWLGERVTGKGRPDDNQVLATERRLAALMPAALAASPGVLSFSVAVYETDVFA